MLWPQNQHHTGDALTSESRLHRRRSDLRVTITQEMLWPQSHHHTGDALTSESRSHRRCSDLRVTITQAMLWPQSQHHTGDALTSESASHRRCSDLRVTITQAMLWPQSQHHTGDALTSESASHRWCSDLRVTITQAMLWPHSQHHTGDALTSESRSHRRHSDLLTSVYYAILRSVTLTGYIVIHRGWGNLLIAFFLWTFVAVVANKSNSLCSWPRGLQHARLPVLHYFLELAQTHVHWVGDANQPSHPLSSPSPPALNLSQHQGLFQWIGSLHRGPKDWSIWTFRFLLISDFEKGCCDKSTCIERFGLPRRR